MTAGRRDSVVEQPSSSVAAALPGIGQVAGPPGQLGVVAELGQAGHRAADLGGGGVPACPYHLRVHLLAGAEYLDADLLD